jgi:hypothetical protein
VRNSNSTDAEHRRQHELRLMEAVARHFYGDPNQRLSSKDELRFGTNGSLSVDLRKGVYYDHENNQGGGPLDLIRFRTGITDAASCYQWAEREGYWRKPNGRDHRRSRSREVAYYDYVDEAGAMRFQVVRFEPKTFKQRRPNGYGGWLWNVDGVTPLPYRLPELLEAIGNAHIVCVPEGEKDVDRLRSLGVPATCNAGGANKWQDALTTHFADADVVVIADNDAPGRKHAHDVAAKLQGVAKRVRVLELVKQWPQCPHKGDISDWIEQTNATAEQLYALIEQLPDWDASQADGEEEAQADDAQPFGQTSVPRFVLKRLDQLVINTAPNYLIKGLLPRVGLGVIWGWYKSGKSFSVLDMALCIAHGRDYHGRRTKSGPVVYIALEGGSRYPDRTTAWHLINNVPQHGAPFYLLSEVQFDLFTDSAALIASIHAQVAEPPVAIFVDTLNRAINGSENKPEDMARFVRGCDALRIAFQCFIGILHHSGAAGNDRPRGHTSLAGADDVGIAISTGASKLITLHVDHIRDDAPASDLTFGLETVQVATNDEGDPIISAAVVALAGPAKSVPKLSGYDKIAYNLLVGLIADCGQAAPASNRIPAGQIGVSAPLWRTLFYKSHPSDPGNKADTAGRAFRRAVGKLQSLGAISIWDDFVWLPDKPDKGGH